MNVLRGEFLQTDTATAVTYNVNLEQSDKQTNPALSIKTEPGVDPLDASTEAAHGVQRTADGPTDAHRAGIGA